MSKAGNSAFMINSELSDDEQKIVFEATLEIMSILKAKGLSHFQAERALEFTKVVLKEELV